MRIQLVVAAVACLAGLGLSQDVRGLVSSRPAAALASHAPLRHALHRLKGEASDDKGPDGNDSCRHANDRECDEPELGTGACPAGTDATDCWRIRAHVEDDSCSFAHDGDCDEPRFGTGACTQGTDHTDCGEVAALRFQNDSCDTAFNNVCDEPGHAGGSGKCAPRTDRRDCVGAQRPMSIQDHYFGRDDRVFVDRTQFPWRIVGEYHAASGGSCTATLIGRNVLITAAHCVHTDEGELNAGGTFTTAQGLAGGPYEARVIAYYLNPRFDYRRFSGTNEIDNLDWVLLRIDRPLGDRLGTAGVFDLTDQSLAQARAADLYQAGYGWDTHGHLAANIGCHLIWTFQDGTFLHECDTTRGDSGSPFMVRDGDRYNVIGVDSNFRHNPHGPAMYVAVSASNFQPYVAAFRAGRIGHRAIDPTKRHPTPKDARAARPPRRTH